MKTKYNDRQFEIEKDSKDIIFVLFRDPWCSKCIDIEYILKEVDEKISIYRLDISSNLDLIDKYSVFTKIILPY